MAHQLNEVVSIRFAAFLYAKIKTGLKLVHANIGWQAVKSTCGASALHSYVLFKEQGKSLKGDLACVSKGHITALHN